MRAFACGFVFALGLAGCVDTSSRCHAPVAWQPCAGSPAEPGAGGAPPSIVTLSLPTCAFRDDPEARGTLDVTDADGDAQIAKFSFYVGPRINESEFPLADAARNGGEWSGGVVISVPEAMPQGPEITYDVRVKVTDRAGNQSAPVCNTFSLVH